MFDPILPKRKLIDSAQILRKLSKELGDYAKDTRLVCRNYEVPTTFRLAAYTQRTRSAKTGRLIKRRGMRHLGYRRTNMLKGSWSIRGPHMKGAALEVIIGSDSGKAPYNIFVRGPKKGERHQSARMAAKGWRSVTDIKKDYWPEKQRNIVKILQGG